MHNLKISILCLKMEDMGGMILTNHNLNPVIYFKNIFDLDF